MSNANIACLHWFLQICQLQGLFTCIKWLRLGGGCWASRLYPRISGTGARVCCHGRGISAAWSSLSGKLGLLNWTLDTRIAFRLWNVLSSTTHALCFCWHYHSQLVDYYSSYFVCVFVYPSLASYDKESNILYTCNLSRIPILTDPSYCGSCDMKVISLVLDPDNVYIRVTQSLTPVISSSRVF